MIANTPPSHDSAILHAEVMRGAFTNLQRYLQDGRRLQALDRQALASFWIGGMREWARVIEPRPHDLEDADAEFALRQEQPPVDFVRSELATILAGSEKVMDSLPADAIEAAQAEMQSAFNAERRRSN